MLKGSASLLSMTHILMLKSKVNPVLSSTVQSCIFVDIVFKVKIHGEI